MPEFCNALMKQQLERLAFLDGEDSFTLILVHDELLQNDKSIYIYIYILYIYRI